MIRMDKLLIATKNPGKLFEISQFLSDLPLEIVSLKDLGITEDVLEDGQTYEENSKKKALFYAKKSGLPTIADDGGIEIDALEAAPGVRSRRYFGKNGKEATDQEITDAMEDLIKKFPEGKRGATFKTVITLATPDGRYFCVKGSVAGVIREQPHRQPIPGYPYRTFFYLPKLGKYYHESNLSEKEQKLYNHRYKAMQKLKPIIAKSLELREL